MIVHHVRKIHIGAVGEYARVLNIPAEPHPLFIRGVVHIDDRVRHADEHGGIAQLLPLNGEFAVDASALAHNGNLGALQIRLPHIHGDAADRAVFEHDLRAHDAGERLHGKLGLVHNALFVDVFCKGADAVSAHLGLAAVLVDNAHADIRAVAVFNDQQAVRADARLPVAKPRRKRLIVERIRPPVKDDKVIAQSVNLRKLHVPNFSLSIHSCVSRP